MSVTGGVRPVSEVARDLGIAREHLIPYGDDKAKIRLEARATSLTGRTLPVTLMEVSLTHRAYADSPLEVTERPGQRCRRGSGCPV